MKSFAQYITESEHEDMPIYRLSGKPHLPHIEVADSTGGIHHAPFHSETKEGVIRYDFTDVMNAAIKRNAFLKIGNGPGVKELSYHHGRDFRHDVFDKSAKLFPKEIKIMSYTPSPRGDDEPPAESPEPRLKKARRLGSPAKVGGGRKIPRKAPRKEKV